jgi:hypothetical protein
MNLFAQTAQTGIQTLHLLGGGDNAGTVQAYNQAYGLQSARFAALNRINTAEGNIAAINQDRVLTNVAIEMNQQQAEAMAQVNAAAAGVSGGSIDTVMQGIAGNAAMARQRAKAEANQLTEQQLSGINNAFMDLKSIPDTPESDPLMAGLSAGIDATVQYFTGGSGGVSNIQQGEAFASLWRG